MATIRERLVYAIDFVTDSAQKSIGGFRQQVSQAEGTVNKFKAGASSAMSTVGANAGTLAIAGGAALATFGKKAIDAFTETSKAAIDLGAAIGTSTEDASRWIAVADDFEVSAEQLTTGLGKIAKTLDDTSWAEYGISTRDASGEARATNDILLDTFDMLGKIENQTERARVGNDLFGKGYANLAPLIGQTRKEYEDMLDAVSDGQVITAEEAEKAEEFRLAQDQLNDALKDFTVLLGTELAPAAKRAAEDLATVVEGITGLKGAIEGIPGLDNVLEFEMLNPFGPFRKGLEEVQNLVGQSDEGLAELGDAVKDVGDVAETSLPPVAEGLEAVADAARDADPAWRAYLDSQQSALANAEGAPGTFEDMERAVEGVNDAAADAAAEGLAAFQQAITDAQDAITGKFDEFRDTLDMQDLLGDIAEQVDRVNEAAEKLGEGGEQEARNYRAEVRRLQGQVLDLLQTYEDIPPAKITEIITRISQGDVNEILRVIDELTKDRFIRVGVIVPDTHDAFHDINTIIGGGAPAPIFNNPNPAPTIGTSGGGGVTAQTFVTVNQLSSSPGKQYIDRQIDDRRNGVR